MRLDKYLKVSRIIKRRTVANEACDSGRVMLNDKVARASAEVKIGDVIEVAFGTKAVKVRVTSVQETIRKENTKEMFDSDALNFRQAGHPSYEAPAMPTKPSTMPNAVIATEPLPMT